MIGVDCDSDKRCEVMVNNAVIAKAIGSLFIVTICLGMVDAYMVAPLLHSSLTEFHLYADRFYLGAFSILFMALGVVGIAILFYPVLEKHSKFIALTYLCSRVMECMLLLIGVLAYFLLLSVSQEAVQSGAQEGSYYHLITELAIQARYSGYQVAMLILGIASMLLCYLLYITRLFPRWISVLGFVGYAMVFVSAPLSLLGLIDTNGVGGLLYIPGGVFELLVLPIWLIARGFNSPSEH